MRVLVTGGTGFVGSHQVVGLLDHDYQVCIIDNLTNSLPAVLDRIEELTGQRPGFHRIDVRDTEAVRQVIEQFRPDAVMHFAGMKHVGESTTIPREYYDANVGGLLSLLKAAGPTPLRRLVFSSSGSVYGETTDLPIVESHPHHPSNPYSSTKSMAERILADLCRTDEGWSAVALRYFNPAGAHPSGRLGEWCLGPPSNLLPRLIEAAIGPDGVVEIHGDDFDTGDGTGVRDYVHVSDVARAHLAALDRMDHPDFSPDRFEAVNIGRGLGVSVLELIEAVEQASGRTLTRRVGPRRPGDVSALYGDTTLAAKRLGMTDYRPLDEICVDAWRFRIDNPNGYQT